MMTWLLYRYVRKKPYMKKTVRCRKHAINVEVADCFAKKAIGLMYRERMGRNSGMLFEFPFDHEWKIWMLNMRFPLDVIWLDKGKMIVHVERNLQPCRSSFSCKSYAPKRKSRYVIELNAGTASRFGIRLGQRISVG